MDLAIELQLHRRSFESAFHSEIFWEILGQKKTQDEQVLGFRFDFSTEVRFDLRELVLERCLEPEWLEPQQPRSWLYIPTPYSVPLNDWSSPAWLKLS